MKNIKKRLALVLVIILILSSFVMPVFAYSESKTKNMMGSHSITGYQNNAGFYNGGLSGGWIEGTSYTKWMGSSPFNADNITHRDIITTNVIGSLSLSGGGGSVSISWPEITSSYSVANTWHVDVNYDYTVNGVLLSMHFNTGATVQFGSSFYTWTTPL